MLEKPSLNAGKEKDETDKETQVVSEEATELETKEVISEGSGEDAVKVASEEVTEQPTEKRSQGTTNRGSVKDVEAKSEDEFEVDGGYGAMNTRSVVVTK